MLRFDTVDSSDPTGCIAFLDLASSIDEVQSFKRRSIERLELCAGDTVLDVGCGTGTEVLAIAVRVGTTGRAWGVDASRVMVAESQRRARLVGLPARIIQGDVYRLPFAAQHFDAVRADRILHFLESPRAALLEMTRVAKPGARIGVGEPSWNALRVEGVDRALTTLILDAIRTSRGPQAIGDGLPELFASVGLAHARSERADLELRTLHSIDRLFHLEHRVLRAVAHGRLARELADLWFHALAEADRSGELRCVLPGSTVIAEK
jgi:SAM-dependent methyltransferase